MTLHVRHCCGLVGVLVAPVLASMVLMAIPATTLAASGKGRIEGTVAIEGKPKAHPTRVRFAYQATAWGVFTEAAPGFLVKPPGKLHYLRLHHIKQHRISAVQTELAGQFKVALAGCPPDLKSLGCNVRATYEVYASYQHRRCSESMYVNVTSGEAVRLVQSTTTSAGEKAETAGLTCT